MRPEIRNKQLFVDADGIVVRHAGDIIGHGAGYALAVGDESELVRQRLRIFHIVQIQRLHQMHGLMLFRLGRGLVYTWSNMNCRSAYVASRTMGSISTIPPPLASIRR